MKKNFKSWLMMRLPKSLLAKWLEYDAIRMYDKYVEKAEKMHAKINERVYVLTAGVNGLVLTTRDGWRNAKRKGIVDKNINMNDIRNRCVYCTATRFNTEELTNKERTERRIAFVRWYVGNMEKLVGKLTINN